MLSESFERRVLRAERDALREVMRRVEPGRHRGGPWQQQAFEDCEQRLRQLDSGEITARQIVHDILATAAKDATGQEVHVSDADIDTLSFVWRTSTIRGIRNAWRKYGDNVLRLDAAGVPVEGRADRGKRREAIAERVRHEVWRRDDGRCVDCGSRERLEFDHIIPISKGGSNTARNIELRCEVCNRRKSATI
jgi:hypothetical protein